MSIVMLFLLQGSKSYIVSKVLFTFDTDRILKFSKNYLYIKKILSVSSVFIHPNIKRK